MMEYLRVFVFGLFVNYLKCDYLRLFFFGLFVDYSKHSLFEIICLWNICDYVQIQIVCGLFVKDYLWIVC